MSARFIGVGLSAPLILLTAMLAPAADVNSEIELLRSDVRAEKVAIITREMKLTDEQSTAFWPVYKRYEGELSKIFDDKIALVKDYAANYGQVSDAKARELLEKVFQLEDRTTSLQRKYAREMGAVLPAKVVTRFFQVERRMNRLIDMQISANVPLMK
jgi:Spy/CpxP family protein refolding chaperone